MSKVEQQGNADGRRQRSERSRQAIINASLSLMNDGNFNILSQEYNADDIIELNYTNGSSRKRNALIGMGLGAAAGWALGYIIHSGKRVRDCHKDALFGLGCSVDRLNPSTPIFSIGVGMGLGAALGAISTQVTTIKIPINGSTKNFKRQKAALKDLAIIK